MARVVTVVWAVWNKQNNIIWRGRRCTSNVVVNYGLDNLNK
jgi:carbohydrate-binding DOMON domain-containing protein